MMQWGLSFTISFFWMVNSKSLRTSYCLTKAILTGKMVQPIKSNKTKIICFIVSITIFADMVLGVQPFISQQELLFQIQL